MEKRNHGQNIVDSFTIRGTNQVVRAGDCVQMRPSFHSDDDEPPSVARVQAMEQCGGCDGVKVRVQWYYRPEDAKGGRRPFHGDKELFLSDHFDRRSAHTIDGKCVVHSLKNYAKLDCARPEDFFCRFQYKSATGSITPDRVPVYCKCEFPYNPDLLMIKCKDCRDRFHPSCIGMNINKARRLNHFVCSDCVKIDTKEHSNSSAASSNSKPEESYFFIVNTNVKGTYVVIRGVPRDGGPIDDDREDNVSTNGRKHKLDNTPPRSKKRKSHG